MICVQLGDRRQRRNRSNVQLVRTTRSRNNDVAWPSSPPSPYGRARYTPSVYTKVSKNTTQLIFFKNALRPLTSLSHPWARSPAVVINMF
jgi:hypothetical protein